MNQNYHLKIRSSAKLLILNFTLSNMLRLLRAICYEKYLKTIILNFGILQVIVITFYEMIKNSYESLKYPYLKIIIH